MYPELPGGISSFSAVTSIALSVSLLYVYFKIDEINLSFKGFSLYCVVCALFAFLFAKFTFGISYLPVVGFSLYNLLYYSINGGIVFYGGLFGVTFGILFLSHLMKRDGKQLLDFFSPAFPLFHSIARFACLLGGCCYGVPSHWGVVMADSPDVVRFPIQIIESICCFCIFIFLTVHTKRNKSYNGNFIRYLSIYAFCRFFLEFFRGDADRGIWFWNLSTSQLISIFILFIMVCQLIGSRKFLKKRNGPLISE